MQASSLRLACGSVTQSAAARAGVCKLGEDRGHQDRHLLLHLSIDRCVALRRRRTSRAHGSKRSARFRIVGGWIRFAAHPRDSMLTSARTTGSRLRSARMARSGGTAPMSPRPPSWASWTPSVPKRALGTHRIRRPGLGKSKNPQTSPAGSSWPSDVNHAARGAGAPRVLRAHNLRSQPDRGRGPFGGVPGCRRDWAEDPAPRERPPFLTARPARGRGVERASDWARDVGGRAKRPPVPYATNNEGRRQSVREGPGVGRRRGGRHSSRRVTPR